METDNTEICGQVLRLHHDVISRANNYITDYVIMTKNSKLYFLILSFEVIYSLLLYNVIYTNVKEL